MTHDQRADRGLAWLAAAPIRGATDRLFVAALHRGTIHSSARHEAPTDALLVRIGLHEASHAAVARAGSCTVRLELHLDQAGVGGSCWFSGPSRTDPQLRRLIGLAGVVGEMLGTYGGDAGVGMLLHTLTRCGALVDVDRELAGPFTALDVATCAQVLRARWPAVVDEARTFINFELRRLGLRA